MPVVRINDAAFGDLKTLSTWFGTKTPAETIDRMVRDAMDQLGLERDHDADEAVVTTATGAMEFERVPGLSFTKPLSAKINGKSIAAPRWAGILTTMIAQGKAKGLQGEALVRELNIPAKTGKHEDEGFRYLPALGISVQGQSAADAWKETDRLAKHWGIPVIVEFRWRQNPKAQFPGRTGILRSGK